MENLHKIKQLLLGLSILLINNSYAQFVATPGTSNEFMGTDPIIRGVGIGSFPVNQITDAALHVNTNYMNPSFNYPSINFGEVFRTDCPSDMSSYWRMFRGSVERTTEYGNIYSLSPADDFAGYNSTRGIHFYVQASYEDIDNNLYGDLRFNTGRHNNLGLGIPRLRVMGDNGYVGIGDYTQFQPQNLLHLHISGDFVYQQFTELNSGITGSDGYLVGIKSVLSSPGGLGLYPNDAQHIQQESDPIEFFTNTQDPSYSGNYTNGLRLRITDALNASGGRVTRIGIPYYRETWYAKVTGGADHSVPVSLVHMGAGWATGLGGHRTWMDVGTYTNWHTDMMYFGLKNAAPLDDEDAVIGWGDNDLQNVTDRGNVLRFIFTGIPGLGEASNYDGLETARINYDGMFGIGNFTNPGAGNGYGFAPVRKLEIYDQHQLIGPTGALPDAPQLRLTYTPRANIANGIWTDFQTMNNGDLYMHPCSDASGTITNRNVGINTSTPATTLEINSNDGTAYPGNSGLTLTDLLANTSIPISTNPWSTGNHSVLTVDATGKVILVKDDDGGASAVCTPGTTNFINKWDAGKVCSSQIFEETYPPYKVGIGTTSLSGPVAQLAVVNTATGTGNISNIYGKVDGGNLATNTKGFVLDVSNGTSTTFGIYGTVKSDDGNLTGMYLKAYPPGNGNAGQTITGADIIADQFNATSQGTVTGVSITATGSNTNNLLYGIKASNYSNIAGTNTNSSGADITVVNQGDDGHSYGIKAAVTTNYADDIETYGGNFSMLSHYSDNSIIHSIHGRAAADHADNSEIAGGYFEGGAIGSSGSNVFGIYAIANYGANLNYGVYASGGQNCTATTTTTGCPNAAGYFSGDLLATHALYQGSDMILKDNIQPLVNASAIISQLSPKTYTFKTLNYPSLHLADGNHFGLITEDVELVLPELVRGFKEPEVKDSSGTIISPQVDYKGLNYIAFIPILIAGFKEQQLTIDSLRNVIAGVPKLSNPNNNQKNKIEVELSNQNSIILNQNDPNPFAENTTITYNIPATVNTAQLMFYDNTGTVLKTVDILERGEGSILVYASNLSKGIYNYTLLIDGKVFETKKMVKQ